MWRTTVRGNPVAFSALHLERLLALDGDQGARTILKSHPVQSVVVDDSGVICDIDTPSDLLKNITLPVGRPEK